MTSKARELANLGNAYSDGALSNRNKIINGAMTIDQRNAGAAFTSLTTGGTYTLDRWTAILTGAADKFSVQKNAGGATPPAGFSSYLGVTSLSAYSVAAGDFFQIKQTVEGFNTADLSYGTSSAKDITVSFWVRSSLTGNFGLVISWGSSAANQRSYPVLYAISAANTWEYKTITIPGDTTMAAGGFETGNGSGVQLRFSLGGGASNAGTPGAWATANSQTVVGDTSVVGTNGATWQITGVQLEAGDTATPFEHRSYGQELALCERYYRKVKTREMWGVFEAADRLVMYGQNRVVMRALPTVTRLSPVIVGTIQGAKLDSGWYFVGPATGGIAIAFTTTTTVTTIGIPATLDGNDFLDISAEL